MSFDLDSVFDYHRPFGKQSARYQAIREQAKSFAEFVTANCPVSREQSLALTSIQEAAMWAHQAIAVNEKEIV